MAEFRQGFTQDTSSAGAVTKVINTTVTGLAETGLEDVNKWRTVLTANPSFLAFKLPPSLQADIDQINRSLDPIGLKLPSADLAENALKKALGDLANPVLLEADKVIGGLIGDGQKLLKSALSQIEQISWLG